MGKIPDAAFFLEKTAEGEIPSKIRLSSATNRLYVKRNERASILCTIHDDEGRFVPADGNQIIFRIEGPGRLIGANPVSLTDGIAGIAFTADSLSGMADIIAESPGLQSDTLRIEILNRIWVDRFEKYESLTNLKYVWLIRAGTTAGLQLINSIHENPGASLRINYTIGENTAPYAGVYRFMDEDLTASEDLEFWFRGDGSGRTLSVLIYEREGRYWRYDHPITTMESEFMRIPLAEFAANDTASAIRLNSVDEMSFNILKGNGDPGSGSISLDDINFVIPSMETGLNETDQAQLSANFYLGQNYPNPFNNSTTIRYHLPQAGKVTVEVFDATGKMVDRLIDGTQQKAGAHQIVWQNMRMASGLYFYRVRSRQFDAVRKCILLK
jgi:hypothetical protein